MDAENFNPFTQDILEKARIGIWVIEILNNQHPKMTIDGVMEDLFGVKGKKYTPEELYDIWYNNLDKDYLDEINKALSKMKKGTKIEVQYPWKHPKKGTTYFRCGGVRDKSFKEGYRFGGSCQDISEVVHIQKQTEKKEEELKSVRKDILTYTGIMQAICRNYESLYYVNIKTFEYQEFVSNGSFKSLKVQRHGKDFFEDSANEIPKVIYVTDRRKLLDFMKKETIMPDLLERKTMSIRYRILVNKTPVYYQMKVVPAADNDQDHYLFAIQNIETQVEKENQYTERLRAAAEMANTDGLTGVKNRLAYEKAEEIMNSEITSGVMNPFSICVFDVNNLKKMNDKYGHEAGDELLCDASKMICSFFSHSPVYRIGGDEFAVILIGADYFDRKTIISAFRKKCLANNKKSDSVVIACGLAEYDFNKDKLLEDVFARADKEMYLNKKKLKENKK